MALAEYRKKRNFKETPEPAQGKRASTVKLIFVIQRHKATRLHYDLRLEMNGVLKSWAVPKGPSLNPADKRLAMMVEDHPFSYRNFAGIIPKGNYGAGIVEIWDQGTLTDIEGNQGREAEKNLMAGLKAGNLKFVLKGKKLKGEFALVRLKNAEQNAWLLIKHRDNYATNGPYNSEDHTPASSPINKWLQKQGRKAPVPSAKRKSPAVKATKKAVAKKKRHQTVVAEKKLKYYTKAMLAKEVDRPFDDEGWIFEMKYDGFRAIAELNGKNVRLYSRNGNSFNETYPLVVEALARLNINAVVDGEIIALDEKGRSDFQRLQQYKTDNSAPVEFRLFDLLELKGRSLTDQPLLERKQILKKILGEGNQIVKYSDHITGKGKAFFEAAKEMDLEGIIAKKADAEYFPGARSKVWLKIKNHKSTEALVAGYTAPGGSRKFFGSLILGIREGEELRYIGHTGSGFDQKLLASLHKKLQKLEVSKSPFKDQVKTNMPATWVKPLLVAEIKYTEWTRDGLLRHPIFLRLREDKEPAEITMKNNKPLKTSAAGKKVAEKTTARSSGKRTAVSKTKAAAKKESSKQEEQFLKVGRSKVRVTNLDKIYWPEEGFTKADVINYYLQAGEYILPYLKGRPQSLRRNPNGIKDFGFFHKDAGEEAPSFVKSEAIYSEGAKKTIDYIVCNNQATLTYLNNLGCIEINPWHSTINKQNFPDYMIIDIDPAEKNSFNQVVEAANVVYGILRRAGADAYCKTSGASGLHVYVPMGKKYDYEQVKDFAHLICMLAVEELPSFTTLVRNLKKRGNKHIYMDYLQNRKGQTISSVYSLRPKQGATVSMPLHWKEVKPGLSPQDFHINNAIKRIKKTGDIFRPVLGKGVNLKKCLKNLER